MVEILSSSSWPFKDECSRSSLYNTGRSMNQICFCLRVAAALTLHNMQATSVPHLANYLETAVSTDSDTVFLCRCITFLVVLCWLLLWGRFWSFASSWRLTNIDMQFFS